MSGDIQLDPRVVFPDLPITERVPAIAEAIRDHQVVIVAGETGSGKTTQLPKICLAMGRGIDARIGCTQPRRIAATSVAARVAQELDTQLGAVVGYKIRFSDKLGQSSRVKFMTDGILLAEIQSDPLLRQYDTLIIDEAHERSLNIDFLLGFLKQLLPRRRDLRVVISSATLEIERFQKFFGGAPVVEVSGRTYPVDVLYRPPTEDEADLAELVANAVNEIAEMDPHGDVLVFLPGEREIREAMGELEQRALPHTELLPLYGRLAAADQQRVFSRGTGRRVVLATNVAETSLTIPGIVYVVDSGVARINRYEPRSGVSQLLVEDVSRASADQRKGRCGRTQNGICVRLYDEKNYLARDAYTDPEIKRVSLAGVILRMKSLRLGDISAFPFLDPPDKRAINDGYRVLEELGAIDEEYNLTQIGVQLSKLPLDPRLARMILGGRDEHALREVVIIAAALGLRDPRDRPQAAQQQADEAHRAWRDEGSDFVSYLKMWSFWKDAQESRSRRALQKLCRDKFLSYMRLREWDDIHDQIVRVMKEMEWAPNAQPASGEQIHRALLPGLLSRIGMYNKEARNYFGARQTRFTIHPSSGIAKKPPAWVMAAELVETSQLFARTCAKIEPAWLERAGGDLCKRNYGDPHWEQRSAQVMVKENTTLFGLPIVRDRSVTYTDRNPSLCREMFITHALVRHEYTSKGAFMAHNARVLADAQRMRDKARRSDMFADDDQVAQFFDARLPPSVVSGKTFEQWRADAERRDPKILFLSLADILLGEPDLTTARYPDQLEIGGVPLHLSYRFEPGEDDDGITITVPLAVLPQLDPDVMEWTIPGWHQPKILALLESLPKSLRKKLQPLDLLATELAAAVQPFSGPMLPALARAIYQKTGDRITPDQWDLRAVPRYLDFSYRVIDDHDKPLAASKDLRDLQDQLGNRARALWTASPREAIERSQLRTFPDALPETVTVAINGRKVQAFPALVDREHHVDLKTLESAPAALQATREGLRRLYLFDSGNSFSRLDAQMHAPLGDRRALVMRALDEAFHLTAPPPRTRADYERRLELGCNALPIEVARSGRIASELSAELTPIKAALQPLVGKPGVAKIFVDDVQSQLAHLAPPDLYQRTGFDRLEAIVRYLKALRIRIQRQAVDPMKDQQKATHVVPLWQQYIAQRPALLAKGRTEKELDEFSWLVEELRVQIFAPEVKPALSINLARVQDAWAKLR
ncbi:MAG TPA: ATP-dependent RNA helicase HrpA [Kofleriaceae bacterium]|nr:ATP-dependent RNA helicase HrpA [Kofleriaceae bacterium]